MIRPAVSIREGSRLELARLEALWPLLGPPLPYHQRLCELTGGIKSGLMFSLSVHWTREEHTQGRDGWLARTAIQWCDLTGLSVKEQATVRARLRELGLVEERRIGQPARLEHRVVATALGNRLSDHLHLAIPPLDWAEEHVMAELLGPSIAFHRRLMQSCGGLYAGLLMSRVVHQMRLQAQRGQPCWVRSEASRWHGELGLTRREQESVRGNLLRLGVWEEQLAGNPARVNVRVRLEALGDLLRSDQDRRGAVLGAPVSLHKTANQDCGETTFLTCRNVETRLAKKVKLNIGIEYSKYSLIQPPPQQHVARATNQAASTGRQSTCEVPREDGLPEPQAVPLVLPEGLLREEADLAISMVRSLEPDRAQVVLDELAGRMASTNPPRQPLSYLRGLIERAMADSFVPELAPRIARLRGPRGATPGLQGLGSKTVEPGLSIGWDGAKHGPAQVADAQMAAAIDRAPGDASAPAGVTHAAPEAVATAAGTAADVAGAEMSALQLRRAESLRQLRDVSQRLSARHGPLPPRAPRKFNKEQR